MSEAGVQQVVDAQALDAVDDLLQAVPAEGKPPGVGKVQEGSKAPGSDLQRGTGSLAPMGPIYRRTGSYIIDIHQSANE